MTMITIIIQRVIPIFTEPEVIPQNVVEIVHNTVPPNLFNETTGIDLYIEVLNIVESFVIDQ